MTIERLKEILTWIILDSIFNFDKKITIYSNNTHKESRSVPVLICYLNHTIGVDKDLAERFTNWFIFEFKTPNIKELNIVLDKIKLPFFNKKKFISKTGNKMEIINKYFSFNNETLDKDFKSVFDSVLIFHYKNKLLPFDIKKINEIYF